MKTLDRKALRQPLADAVRQAGTEGAVIKRKGKVDFALMPLDDELMDYILEHSPRLIRECQEIRKRMEAGEGHRLEDVIKELGIDVNAKEPSKRTGRAVKRMSK